MLVGMHSVVTARRQSFRLVRCACSLGRNPLRQWQKCLMDRLYASDGGVPCMKSLQPKVLSASRVRGGASTAAQPGIISALRIKAACASGYSVRASIAILRKEQQ